MFLFYLILLVLKFDAIKWSQKHCLNSDHVTSIAQFYHPFNKLKNLSFENVFIPLGIV